MFSTIIVNRNVCLPGISLIIIVNFSIPYFYRVPWFLLLDLVDLLYFDYKGNIINKAQVIHGSSSFKTMLISHSLTGMFLKNGRMHHYDFSLELLSKNRIIDKLQWF